MSNLMNKADLPNQKAHEPKEAAKQPPQVRKIFHENGNEKNRNKSYRFNFLCLLNKFVFCWSRSNRKYYQLLPCLYL